VGVTTRTIRYYEELGLLRADTERPKGGHRVYREADVKRLQELIRLRDLLGLSLEELIELAEAEGAREALRNRWDSDVDDRERLRIIDAATPLVEQQLKLVRARRAALGKFAAELEEKLTAMRIHRDELEAQLQVPQRQAG
jgi:DNA-binding transcriptional MerR regulator